MAKTEERAAGFYWVDFGWDTGPVVAQWIPPDAVAASYAGSAWRPPSGGVVGIWQLPSDESEMPDGTGAKVLGERLLPPGKR